MKEKIWNWQHENRRPSWDEFMMMHAEVASTRSTCDRGPDQRFRDHKGTGAVICTPDYRKVSMGYNGSPPGQPHCDEMRCTEYGCGFVWGVTSDLMSSIDCPECGSLGTVKGGHIIHDGHCIATIHAEENAILNASFELIGCYLYCTTKPCYDCCKRIISVGILKVFYQHAYASRYSLEDRGIRLLSNAGIEVRRLGIGFNDESSS